jgi:hypothetical protein
MKLSAALDNLRYRRAAFSLFQGVAHRDMNDSFKKILRFCDFQNHAC